MCTHTNSARGRRKPIQNRVFSFGERAWIRCLRLLLPVFPLLLCTNNRFKHNKHDAVRTTLIQQKTLARTHTNTLLLAISQPVFHQMWHETCSFGGNVARALDALVRQTAIDVRSKWFGCLLRCYIYSHIERCQCLIVCEHIIAFDAYIEAI